MKYYAVTCKHGHHGCNKYVPITFAVIAESALQACDCARAQPGVKHTQIVLSCKEIPFETYLEYSKTSAYERAGIKYSKEQYEQILS